MEDSVPPDVRVTLVGVIEAERPEGEQLNVSETEPVKPSRLFKVTPSDPPGEPGRIVRESVAVMLKSAAGTKT